MYHRLYISVRQRIKSFIADLEKILCRTRSQDFDKTIIKLKW